MANEVGLTQSAVHRIWRAFGLQPHRQETWKLSSDPRFIEKVRDIVGLYPNPPERAVVLCMDEKSQIQALDRTAPILDNASTHKAPAIQKWLKAQPRFVLHVTPTSPSWLNLVERWFGELANKKLRGAHRSVHQLNADIRAWIDTWNENARPFVWTKTAEEILDSIARYRVDERRSGRSMSKRPSGEPSGNSASAHATSASRSSAARSWTSSPIVGLQQRHQAEVKCPGRTGNRNGEVVGPVTATMRSESGIATLRASATPARRRWPARSRQLGLCQVLASGQTGSTARP
jgi:hypothetical protein